MRYMLYRVPAGKKIEKILDAGRVYHHYRDNDYRDDTFYKRFGPVSKLVFVGDTWGSEAGTRTKVTVHFRTLKIVVADI